MKISQELPQFPNTKTLIVVAATREAKSYLAHDGELKELGSFKMEDRTYSDKEGMMQKGMFGRTMGTGFVLERKKQKLEDDFVRKLEEHLNEIKKNNEIDSLYLMCPGQIKNHVKETIPHPLDKKLKMTITGNYLNLHPLKLVEKIQKQKGFKSVKFIKESAYKILNKVKK